MSPSFLASHGITSPRSRAAAGAGRLHPQCPRIGGGLELARPASQITVGEVIERFEGSLHLLDCVAIDNVCRIQPGCRLRNVLAEAERLQREYLNSVLLSDVATPGQNLIELTVNVPPAPKPRSGRGSRVKP
ncbi:MAG: Rrf2 family transcriptional regulator [Planctomycetaceae bacterium]